MENVYQLIILFNFHGKVVIPLMLVGTVAAATQFQFNVSSTVIISIWLNA